MLLVELTIQKEEVCCADGSIQIHVDHRFQIEMRSSANVPQLDYTRIVSKQDSQCFLNLS
jgi:hypothetical protein